jgi:hypothetical protein
VTAEEYRPGELVDITIRGARVRELDSLNYLSATYDQGTLSIRPGANDVTVTRVAPPEWPPRPGDVWVDRDDDVWIGVDAERLGYLGTAIPEDADLVLRNNGPLRLVHRKPEPDGGESGE